MKTNFILMNNLVYKNCSYILQIWFCRNSTEGFQVIVLRFFYQIYFKNVGHGFFTASSATSPSPFFSPICHLDYIVFAHLPSSILRLLQLELMWWVWNIQHEPQRAQLTLSHGWKHRAEKELKNLPSSDKGEFSVCFSKIMVIRSIQWGSCPGLWADDILYTVVTFSWLSCLHYVTEVTARYFNENWSDQEKYFLSTVDKKKKKFGEKSTFFFQGNSVMFWYWLCCCCCSCFLYRIQRICPFSFEK